MITKNLIYDTKKKISVETFIFDETEKLVAARLRADRENNTQKSFCKDFFYLEIVNATKILRNEIKITSRSPFWIDILIKRSCNVKTDDWVTDQLIFIMISAAKNSLSMLLKLPLFQYL